MLSVKYLFYVQTFLVALVMTFIMSFAISAINLGFISGFVPVWMHAWAIAFVVAYPSLMLVLPPARALAMRIACKNGPVA